MTYQQSPYHLILNPDVSFEPRVISELIDFMEDNPEVGLVTPKIRFPDGNLQYLCKLLPTPWDLIGRRFFPFLSACKQRNRIYEMRFADYDEIMDVPFLSGSFMLIRTRAIQEVGMFDERYFLYMEDADLCRRIGEKYRTVYYPKVSITHAYKMASYKELKLLYQHMRSAILYFNKWGWLKDKKRSRINQKAIKVYSSVDQDP
jgi:GT2 family glycosyltransferase